MADIHLIKKLARHYSQEIQVAVSTGEIRDMREFESLLRKFLDDRNRLYNNSRKVIKEQSGKQNTYVTDKDSHKIFLPNVKIEFHKYTEGSYRDTWRNKKGPTKRFMDEKKEPHTPCGEATRVFYRGR